MTPPRSRACGSPACGPSASTRPSRRLRGRRASAGARAAGSERRRPLRRGRRRDAQFSERVRVIYTAAPATSQGTNSSAVDTGRPPELGPLPRAARAVAQAAAADQRGRAAAVEVQRRRAPSARSARPALRASCRRRGAAAVAGDREQPAVGEAERGARVAAVGDVGVELGLAGAEALAIVRARKTGTPSRTSSGPACRRSPRGCGGQLVARGDRRDAAAHVHARAHVGPGSVERDVAAGDAARADLAQRRSRPGRTKNPPTSASSTPRAAHQGSSRA